MDLVEGSDLIVGSDDCVYMRTIDGLKRVDVIYRRVDDLFIDPEAFNPESMLGVPGLMRAWRAKAMWRCAMRRGGRADDKVVYAFVPKIIKYYLGEEPIVPNVPSYLCMYEEDRRYVLDNLDKLVVKPANGRVAAACWSGRIRLPSNARFRRAYQGRPAQLHGATDLDALRCADPVPEGIEPRHVDLRPFILSSGTDTYVTTGGLTRVALVKGSLVVNSSQGWQQGHLDRGYGGSLIMLSRVAENLYWLGRYMERAEDTTRLIQVSRHVMLDFRVPPRWVGRR